MARKTTKAAARAVPMLKQSAHEIWLAGLGAFALAGEEGGKLFKDLVKKGAGLEKTNKALIGKRVDKLMARAERMQGDARQAVTRFAAPIEDGMTGAMHKLGIPTRREIQALTKKVEELTRVVAKAKTRATKRARKARAAAGA
jgi:poly(hydroxyalkanoate) granule-associated protein